MNTLELIDQMCANGFLPRNHPDYSITSTDATYQPIAELNGCLTQNFERAVTNTRSGYWLRRTLTQTTAGKARYRIPPRAVGGGLDRVEIAQNATSAFVPLEETSSTQAAAWELAPASIGADGGSGVPARYEVRGDQVVLLPTPASSSYVLRFWYYLRPSQLVLPQSPTLTSSTTVNAAYNAIIRGRITAVDTTTRTITMNAFPYKMRQTTPAAILTGTDRIDVVHPNGWFELPLVNASCASSVTPLSYVVGGNDPLDDIEVGDYVRAADETDWPCIPEDFHRLLADLATVTCLMQLSLFEKASAFASKIEGDMQRFRDILQPRVRSEARAIPMPAALFAGTGPRFRGGFP